MKNYLSNQKLKSISLKITILGAGNLGSVLAEKFHEAGHQIEQIYNRDEAKGIQLARKVNSTFCNDIKALNNISDIYFLCVKDDALETVSKLLDVKNALVVHCSGSTPLKTLDKHSNCGIFYPLQTFSVNIKPNFEELPICITAKDEKINNKLIELAKSICPNIYLVDEAQRKALHIAAVFVNNFSNHLFSVAENICETSKVDFNILMPLIRQTIRKIELESPRNVQTGPAKRTDFKTIDAHYVWLEKIKPEFMEIYKIMTKSIMDYYSNK